MTRSPAMLDLLDPLAPSPARVTVSPRPREPALTGLDALAQRLRGSAQRRRVSARERRRAGAIERAAFALRDLSERALDARIAEVADAVRLHREDEGTIDEAAAVIVEVIRRQIGLALYREQIMGGLVIAGGACAEMATGEGKTVTAIIPATLDAWLGRGVHVHTVNDYLARRDAHITRPAYTRLGLTVGVLQDDTPREQRRRMYRMDITYGADKQFIFDYLRDRLHMPVAPREIDQDLAAIIPGTSSPDMVQRGLASAIVDEAASVLIDEAITPAIIGLDLPEEAADPRRFAIAARIAADMQPGRDYKVDRPMRQVSLTARGRERLAACAEDLPAFWRGPSRREELLIQALSARELYIRDEDYIIRDGKVCIVDRSTGRVLEGRQWQLGVHQAVEAKEGLATSPDRRTAARISYQRFFQQYRRLAGMTGTAWEVAGELHQHYNLRVVRIPTHRPVIRRQPPDRIHRSARARDEAVADRAAELHAIGRPVLIGTRSVAESERLAEALSARDVPCRVLNAQREAEEAEIVAQAGRTGAVTVATNMAGRGTDIILDDRARELGGLVVIATARNDERRVDRQLYGRAGRQGDPGLAETFVSLEDDLILRYAPRWLVGLARTLPPPLHALLARPLFAVAQRSAGARARVFRDEAAQADSWLEMAMHTRTR